MKFEVIVRGVVKNGDRVLIGLKRRDDPHPLQGEWHFPGGRLEYEENPWRAVEREIEEETGYKVKAEGIIDVIPKKLVWPNEIGEQQTLHIVFSCRLLGGEAKAGDDVEEVKWISVEEIDSYLRKEFLLESELVREFIES